MLVGMHSKKVSSGQRGSTKAENHVVRQGADVGNGNHSLDALVRVAVFPLQPVSRVRGGYGVFQAPVICPHWEGVRPIRRSGG